MGIVPELQDVFFDDETNFVQVLRALLDPTVLRRMRGEILAAEQFSGPSLNPRAETQGVAQDALRVDRRWYEVWRGVDLAPLLQACRGYDQMIFPPQIRHVRTPTHFVPWHQDIAYQMSMGPRGHRRVMTCFVPLGDVLLFGAAIPHRTIVPPGCAPTRVSMEYRLTRGDSMIGGKDYFDLIRRTFYVAGT